MLVMKLISISNPLVKLLIYFIAIAQCCVGRRFAAKGPFLSITLKDDCDKYDSLSSNGGAGRWFDLKSLRPDIRWSIETTGKPLPNWIPNLHSFRTMVGCKYKKETFPDTSIGMDLKFASERTGIDVQIQPSRDLQSKRSNCIIQVSSSLFQRSVGGGKATLMAKLSTRKDSLLQIVKGCYEASLPYRSISAIRVTPAVDFDRGQTSCRFEAVTGTQSTKAVLNLEYDNPTLSVIHSLNSRNTIAPTIFLYDARINYTWNVDLDSSSIRTTVDPASDITVKWTDRSLDGGSWISELNVPLKGATLSALAAKTKVRRQFHF